MLNLSLVSKMFNRVSRLLYQMTRLPKMFLLVPIRNFTRDRWRTFLLVLGIAFAVSLEMGVAITADSLYADFVQNYREHNYTDITVYSKNMDDSIFSLLDSLTSIPGVGKVSPVAKLELSETVLLYGLKGELHPDFSTFNLTSGQRRLNPGEVIISDSLAELLGISPGDRLSFPSYLGTDFPRVDIVITGTISTHYPFGNVIGSQLVLVDLDYLVNDLIHNIVSDESPTYQLAVMVQNIENINTVAESIQDTIGPAYYVFREKSLTHLQETGMHSYQRALNLVLIVSYIVEFLFITNILGINIRERSKEFGVLRAAGTSGFQLVILLGIEILLYSLAGSSLGVVLGSEVSLVLIEILNASYPALTTKNLVIRPLSIVVSFSTGIMVSLTAGIYPVLMALAIPVNQNIHWTMRRGKSRRIKWLYPIAVGLVLAVTGITGTYFIGPSEFLGFELVSGHFIIISLIFLGILLVEGGLLFLLPRIGQLVLIWHKVVPRTIATRNIKREFHKSLLTVLIASLALSFILTVGMTSSALIKAVPTYYSDRFGNIDMLAESLDDDEHLTSFSDDLQTIKGVTDCAYIQQQRTRIGTENGYVFGIDPGDYHFFLEGTVLSPDIPDTAEMLSTPDHGAIISHLFLARLGVRLGEEVTLYDSTNGAVIVTINGIIRGNPFLQDGEYLFISSDLFQEFFAKDTAKWFVMALEEDANPVRTSYNLRDMYSFKEIIHIGYFSDAIKRSLTVQAGFFHILFIHVFLLSGLAQFISIQISTMKMERETGIMRALGLSKQEVFSMFLSESCLLGVAGVFMGIINGFLGSGLLAWYISQSIPVQPELSPWQIAFWAVLSLGITVISTIIPIYRSSNRNVARVITGRFYRGAKRVKKSTDDESVLIDLGSYDMFLHSMKKQLLVVFLLFYQGFIVVYLFAPHIFPAGLLIYELVYEAFLPRLYFERLLLYLAVAICGGLLVGPLTVYFSKKRLPKMTPDLVELIKRTIYTVVLFVTGMFLIFNALLGYLNVISAKFSYWESGQVPEANLLFYSLEFVVILAVIFCLLNFSASFFYKCLMVQYLAEIPISVKKMIKEVWIINNDRKFTMIGYGFAHLFGFLLLLLLLSPNPAPRVEQLDPFQFSILAIYEIIMFLCYIMISLYSILSFKDRQKSLQAKKERYRLKQGPWANLYSSPRREFT